MNKDLYIALLEEHVDELTTAAKIDTVLTERKTIRMRNLEAQLLSLRDWNKAQDELISKIADTAMDYQDDLNELSNLTIDLAKDLNDFAADWAIDRIDLVKVIKGYEADQALSDMTLQEFERDIESLTGESARFRGIIKKLKKEKYDMGMELEKLKKQNENLNEDLVTAEKRIKEAEENK
jgi:predicted  nucleic acid-binding Zn-ribbon protein